MSRVLLSAVAAALLAGPLGAQAPKGKDSPAAAATRKKLAEKVTVDFNETRLQDAMKELKQQVENLSIWIDNAGGVSNNQTITYKAKDKPLAEALDEMFKKNDLGYVIGQTKDKRYDGWLIIKKGKFRGDEEVPKTAAKPGDKPKEKPKVEAKPDEKPETDAEKAERDAARKLKLAKMLAADGLADKAKARYKEIVEKYPGTKAAKEAKQLLEK